MADFTPRAAAAARCAAVNMRGITYRESAYVKCRNHRGVVRGPLPGARHAVDRAGGAALGERLWSLIKDEAIVADRELVAHV